MNKSLAKAIIENLLLATNKPITVNDVKTILNSELRNNDIQKLFADLIIEYEKRNFSIIEIAGGYQFSTKFEYSEWVKNFHKSEKASTISKAALETLAIIAYKQPITRIEIETIRGVDAGGTVRTLLEKSFIRMVGKKKVVGRPMMYGTSRKFLECFGLKNISDLPTLKEFNEKELQDERHNQENRRKEREKENIQLALPLEGTTSENPVKSRNSFKASGGKDNIGWSGDDKRESNN